MICINCFESKKYAIGIIFGNSLCKNCLKEFIESNYSGNQDAFRNWLGRSR